MGGRKQRAAGGEGVQATPRAPARDPLPQLQMKEAAQSVPKQTLNEIKNRGPKEIWLKRVG